MLKSSFLISIICFTITKLSRGDECDLNKFMENSIVPNIINDILKEVLQVTYGNKMVECATLVNINETENTPIIRYTAENKDFFTIVMIDPDAPDPNNPMYAQFLHWLVVNVPGNKVKEGKTLTDYMKPSPPSYSGPHRYILLVYKQSSHISNPSYMKGRKRSRFSVSDLVASLNLKGPIAGNFFFSKSEQNKQKTKQKKIKA